MWENAEFLNAKGDGPYIYHYILKGMHVFKCLSLKDKKRFRNSMPTERWCILLLSAENT